MSTGSVRKLKEMLKEWKINKNLKASQWAALGDLIAKRKREGKETEVILDGTLLGSKKVKRELGRYPAVVSHTDTSASKSPSCMASRIMLRQIQVRGSRLAGG